MLGSLSDSTSNNFALKLANGFRRWSGSGFAKTTSDPPEEVSEHARSESEPREGE
jgi:hypothetical protein